MRPIDISEILRKFLEYLSNVTCTIFKVLIEYTISALHNLINQDHRSEAVFLKKE